MTISRRRYTIIFGGGLSAVWLFAIFVVSEAWELPLMLASGVVAIILGGFVRVTK